MKRLQKAALLLDLMKKMRGNDGWCGETHIQKVVYFLVITQSLAKNL